MTDGYALRTDACTYVLDEEGVCRFVTAPHGDPPEDAYGAIGAQYVACLDLSSPGGLVADLRLGTHALFVRRENGRSLLLRTTPIRGVEERRGPLVPPDPPTIRIRARPMPPRSRHDPDETTLTLVNPLSFKLPSTDAAPPRSRPSPSPPPAPVRLRHGEMPVVKRKR